MTPKAKTFLERTFSTVVLLGLLGGALALDIRAGYAALICLFCNLTTIEWFRMLKERKDEANRPLALVAGLLYPWCMAALVIGASASSRSGAFILFAFSALILYALLAFCCELFRMDYRGRSGRQALASMGITLLSFIYPVWLFTFSLYFLTGRSGIDLLLWLILVTKMSDIWAYVSGVLLGGKIFGERPFSPSVSPKKTWEGIIGSFLLTVACGWGLSFVLLPYAHDVACSDALWMLLSAIVFLLAVPGDLAGSLIKRGLAVKDSGSLLPGIGGIFDLIDSPAFTVSAIFVFSSMVGIAVFAL